MNKKDLQKLKEKIFEQEDKLDIHDPVRKLLFQARCKVTEAMNVIYEQGKRDGYEARISLYEYKGVACSQ